MSETEWEETEADEADEGDEDEPELEPEGSPHEGEEGQEPV